MNKETSATSPEGGLNMTKKDRITTTMERYGGSTRE